MSGHPVYPWSEGDALFASELNAAIANSGAYGPYVPNADVGTGIGQVLGRMIDFNGSGIPGLLFSSGIIFKRNVSAADDFRDFTIQRGTTFTGGTGINSVFVVDTSIGAGDGSMNYGILSVMNSNAIAGRGAVSMLAQANRPAGAHNTPIWAFLSEAADYTGQPSSVAGPLLSQEVGIGAFGADDGANGDRFGGVGLRQAIQFVFIQQPAGVGLTPTEFTAGLWFGTQSATSNPPGNSYVDSMLAFSVGSHIRNALDTRGAVAPTGVTDPVAAVRMPAGHIIDFHGGAALTSPPGNYLWYDNATSKLFYSVAGVNKWSVDASGNMRVAGTITPSVTP